MLNARATMLGSLVGLTLIASHIAAGQQRSPSLAASPGARTIEFETREVTQADVTVSTDGRWLIFTILGHLFRLPIAGGMAEQLTFGPYYDSDPTFSPDGTRVAFVSDRDGDRRNIFILELASGRITQVTRELWADRPTWSPDGRVLVYLSFVAELPALRPALSSVRALVRRMRPGQPVPDTLVTVPRTFQSLFYLEDGRLAWTVLESGPAGSSRLTSRIEALGDDGTLSTLRTLDGIADRVIASPMGDGLYCRCYLGPDLAEGLMSQHLMFIPLSPATVRGIAPLSRQSPPTIIFYDQEPFRFGLTSDHKNLYVGDAGRIWRVATGDGVREAVPFSARVRLEIHEPLMPPKLEFAAPGSSARPRVIREPRISPSGETVVFEAAGHLWQQPLGGGRASRLFDGSALERSPVFSPDGRQLAFISRERRQESVLVYDFVDRATRSVTAVPSSAVSWTRDGQRLVFVEIQGARNVVVAVSVMDGSKTRLADVLLTLWSGPSLSGDGRWLYSAGPAPMRGLQRLRLGENLEPEPMTRLQSPLADGRVSPDGQWLAFRRNGGIWIARLADLPVEEKDIRQLTFEGGEGYDFTPDGSALIYSIRNRVWRHPLMGGAPEEIPIRLELQRPTPRPVLLRRVRLLDYARGGFRDESSVYVDQGRIRWIGSERDQNISPDAVILDAGGRFAIPGLFDMETHLGASGIEQETFLAYGITSLLDVGGGLAWLNTLADRRDASAEPRPRSFFSGPTFYGGGNVNGPLMLRDEDEARTYVRRSKASGVHFIKVFPPMSWAVQRAVTEEARRQGLPVMWHNINLEGITKGVMLGNAFLERLHVSGRLYDDVLRMLAAAGTRWLPTLNMPVGNELLLRTQPERLTDPKLLAFRTESSIRAGLTHNGLDVVTTNEWRGFWSDWLEGVQQAHRLGVTLLAGTDSDCCGRVFFGLSLHWELEHFVDAGLSPLEVLRLATLGAAQAVGAETDLGTLEPGKLADIVLLDKNPIDDIKNTKTIWRVLRDGWIYDPDKLRSLANRSHQVPFRVPLK